LAWAAGIKPVVVGVIPAAQANPAMPLPHLNQMNGFQRLRLWWGVQGGKAHLRGSGAEPRPCANAPAPWLAARGECGYCPRA
jgi:hypothetical protein